MLATQNPGPLAELTGVACPAVSFCISVGSYQAATGRVLPLAEIWHGTTWQLLPTAPLTTNLGELAGISCTPTTSCIAVGGHAGHAAPRTHRRAGRPVARQPSRTRPGDER